MARVDRLFAQHVGHQETTRMNMHMSFVPQKLNKTLDRSVEMEDGYIWLFIIVVPCIFFHMYLTDYVIVLHVYYLGQSLPAYWCV